MFAHWSRHLRRTLKRQQHQIVVATVQQRVHSNSSRCTHLETCLIQLRLIAPTCARREVVIEFEEAHSPASVAVRLSGCRAWDLHQCRCHHDCRVFS